MYRLLTAVLFMVIILSFANCGYCEEEEPLHNPQNQSNQVETSMMPNIETGIPAVTPEQAAGKLKRIIMSIYDLAVEISPYLTLFIFVLGGIAGIFFREARKAVFWAVIGMLFILWGPQLIGLISYYQKM